MLGGEVEERAHVREPPRVSKLVARRRTKRHFSLAFWSQGYWTTFASVLVDPPTTFAHIPLFCEATCTSRQLGRTASSTSFAMELRTGTAAGSMSLRIVDTRIHDDRATGKTQMFGIYWANGGAATFDVDLIDNDFRGNFDSALHPRTPLARASFRVTNNLGLADN